MFSLNYIPRRPKRNSKIHIKSPADITSTGVIFILGKGVSDILASGVNSTWSKGSSEPGFSNFNATSEKFSDFKSSELIQEYDSLCSIDKVPKDIQNLVQQKEKEVTAAQSDAMSRLN